MALTVEQLEQRKHGVGSSEIPMLMGNSPFGTAFDLWDEKVNGVIREGDAATKAGQLFESVIAQWFADTYQTKVQPIRETICHTKRPWQMATMDFYETFGRGRSWRRKAVLEIKNVTNALYAIGWGDAGTDDVPRSVIDQVIWQIDVARSQPGCEDMEYAWVAASFFGRDQRAYKVMYDAEYAAILVERARSFFFDYVLPKRRPEIDGSDGAARWLATEYPTHNDKLVLAEPDVEALVRDYYISSEAEKFAAGYKEKVKQLIQAQIGDNEGIESAPRGWGKATWKHASSGRYNYEKIATDLYAKLAALPPDVRGELPEWQAITAAHALPGARRFYLSLSKSFKARFAEERVVHYRQPDGELACPYKGNLGQVVASLDLVNCDECRANAARRLT